MGVGGPNRLGTSLGNRDEIQILMVRWTSYLLVVLKGVTMKAWIFSKAGILYSSEAEKCSAGTKCDASAQNTI